MIPAVRGSSCCRSTRRNDRAGIWGGASRTSSAPGSGLNIGAKIAAPDKFCVNIMGDAAFGMTGLDFETAVRCGVPILTIVFNNSSMAIETRHMGLSHEKYRARDLGGSYAALARDLGGWSERVEHPGRSARRSCARAGRPRRARPVCSSSSPTRRRRSRKATWRGRSTPGSMMGEAARPAVIEARSGTSRCHCEERSDEAISVGSRLGPFGP